MAYGLWLIVLSSAVRRGKPSNPEADGALQVQLHRVGPIWPIRLHCSVATGNRQSLESTDGQRVPALLLPGEIKTCGGSSHRGPRHGIDLPPSRQIWRGGADASVLYMHTHAYSAESENFFFGLNVTKFFSSRMVPIPALCCVIHIFHVFFWEPSFLLEHFI